MTVDDRCHITEPHDPHRTDSGAWGVKDCPGIPAEPAAREPKTAVGVAAVQPWQPWDGLLAGEVHDVPATALTTDQQIREKALRHAASPYVGVKGDGFEAEGLADAILTLAARFEPYIRDGSR